MKVLFLDIDGVLNSEATTVHWNGFTGVDKELSTRLLNWLEGRGIDVVLSSTWRRHDDMLDGLREAGLAWIGRTPFLNTIRGMEIKSWLEDHKGFENYAILDDSDDMLSEQMSRFVQTDYRVGLQDSDLLKLEAIYG